MRKSSTPDKIISSFHVVGINESKLQKYDIDSNEEPTEKFLQKMDILIGNLDIKNDLYETSNQKWAKITKGQNCWIRFQYSDIYIDPITDFKVKQCDLYSNKYILLPKSLYNFGYRPIRIIKFEDNVNDINQLPKISEEERAFPSLDNKYIVIPIEYDCNSILNFNTKKKAAIILICRKISFLPIIKIFFTNNQNSQNYKINVMRYKSPYSYKYLPEILDSYPNNEAQNKALSMFCFPEGVQIKEEFDTPKCFNFVLTDELGERTYGSAFIFLEEIPISLKESFQPSYDPPDKKIYYQKAICVLSKYPFNYNCLLFLKEIYNISHPQSSGKIPIERAICTFVDSLYIQSYDKLLRFNINNRNLDFYRIANYGKLWDTNDKYLETLFRLLSYEQIITAWEGLLLEKKLYLICSSKATLSHIAHALINLLFPFKWIHVYVPILPEKLRLFIESPVPLIIGISFHIEINELPSDSLILNINKNRFENYNEKIPHLPPKLNKILMCKLNKLKEQYNLDNPQYVDKIMNNLDEAILHLGPDTLLLQKIDTSEIRDAFYSVFLAMFKNYEKYVNWIKQSMNIIGSETVFLKENFLKEFNSTDPNSFLYLFSETSLFSQLVDSFCIEENNIKSSFAFFLESIKKGKGKTNFLQNIIPKNVVFAPKIEIDDLKGKIFNYPIFPKLKKSLFITHEIPKKPYKSKFNYVKDEWCYSPEKFKRKDWPRYFLYLIYDIWFTFFSFVLNIYEDTQSIILMDYALSLIEYLSKTLKIIPTRNLFSKIIKSCARNSLNPFIKQLLIMVKDVNKGNSKFNALFHNDYLNGLYFLTENVGQNLISGPITNSRFLMNTMRTSIITEMKNNDFNIESELNKIIFMTYNICENCLMSKCISKALCYDEILSGFIMRKGDDNTSICSNCLNRFEPKIYFLVKNQKDLNLKEINFYSPMELVKKIDEIINLKGQIYFYKEKNWSDVYWNIIFYFQLFDLPTCVLYVQNNIEKFEKIKNILKENKKRKFNQEKKQPQKKNFFFGKLNKTNTDVGAELSNDNIKTDISSFNSSNNISDTSINSVKSGYSFYSNTEMDIWKNYHLKKQSQKKEKNINQNISNNEDKNEINLRLKETKAFLNDIISIFNSNSQEKLRKFLENYDKLESMRQHDYVNMYLKNENEKYEKNQIKKEKNIIQGKNKNNTKTNLYQTKTQKEDTYNINTRYNNMDQPKINNYTNNMEQPKITNDINNMGPSKINNNYQKEIKNEINIREKATFAPINNSNIQINNSSNQNINNQLDNQNNGEIYNVDINSMNPSTNLNHSNFNINNENNNFEQMTMIYSPKVNKGVSHYQNNNKIMNSSNHNQVLTKNIKDVNIKNLSYLPPEQNINNNPSSINNPKNYRSIQQNNNLNVFNPQIYENKTAKPPYKYNNIINKRYDPKKDNENRGMQNAFLPPQIYQQQNIIQNLNNQNVIYQNEENNQLYPSNFIYQSNFDDPYNI